MDWLQPDDCEKERQIHVAVENGYTLSIYRLTFWLLFPGYAFFQCAYTFLHDHLVATIPHVLHLHLSLTTNKNSCLVGVGITHVTKPAVSWLQSEIQLSTCPCSIGKEPQNTLVFPFFQFDDALCVCSACRLSISVSPLVQKLSFSREAKLRIWIQLRITEK